MIFTEVPEYAQQFGVYLKASGYKRDVFEKFFVDEHGVIYEIQDDGLASPPDFISGLKLKPGHRFDGKAPKRCTQCGTDRLQVFHSDHYETSARCPDCGITEVVHDG